MISPRAGQPRIEASPALDLPRRGRPRSEASRSSILAAAGRQLREAPAADFNIDSVARRAGVGKATIYRWWRSRGALALEAMEEDLGARTVTLPDRGTLRRDLRVYLKSVQRLVAGDAVARLSAALALELESDPEIRAAYRRLVVSPLREAGLGILRRAVARRELPAGADLDLLLDQALGAVLVRQLAGSRPGKGRFIKQLADAVAR